MNIRLDVLVSAIARDAGLDPDNVATDKQNIIGFVDDTRRELYSLEQRLQSLEFTGEIVGTAVVTAGTVAVTNGNSEATGSSTSFTSAMNGRYMSINGSAWQRISFVTDTTHLTLESGWNSTSQTGAGYKIWKRYYALPAKAGKVDRIIDYASPFKALDFYDSQEFYERYGMGDSFSDPVAWTQFSSSEFGYDYLASSVFTSVTTTANSPIVDFPNGSALISTLQVGDRLIIGNSTTSTAFAVDKVLSDVKVALRNFVGTTSSTLTATAIAPDRLLVSFWPAINSTKVYAVEGMRQFYGLSNNGDLLERGWYNAVLKGAVSKAFGYVRDPREENKKAEYEVEVRKLIRDQHKAMNPAPRLRPYIPTRYFTPGNRVSDRDTGD